jgi:ferritin-like metal-binding protein YciE
MAKQPKQIDELFHDGLRDMYFVEKKIVAALPKLAKAAGNDALEAAFVRHEKETGQQLTRLEQIFKMIGKKPQARTCAAILAIIEEGQQIIKEYKGSPALDAGLIAAAQAIEYYEIARYGALRAWAQELDLTEAVALLDKTLDEEEDADDALSDLAEVVVRQAVPRDQAA